MLGGFYLQGLFILIAFDVVIGMMCGYANKNLNSYVGLIGLLKHSVVVLIVILFNVLSDIYNLNEYFNLFIIFYVLQYVLSILENAYCLGVPIPNFLVTKLKDYQDNENLKEWENVENRK